MQSLTGLLKCVVRPYDAKSTVGTNEWIYCMYGTVYMILKTKSNVTDFACDRPPNEMLLYTNARCINLICCYHSRVSIDCQCIVSCFRPRSQRQVRHDMLTCAFWGSNSSRLCNQKE
jgi:hypothetical protein